MSTGARTQQLHRPRVLLVEDDVDQRNLFAWMLRSEGWSVEEAGTGVELLQWIGVATSAPRCPFDVVLADVGMPDLSTIEVLSGWRYGQWSVPFVIVTAQDDPAVRADAYALGAVAVLQKPVPRDALREALEQALAKSRETRASSETPAAPAAAPGQRLA